MKHPWNSQVHEILTVFMDTTTLFMHTIPNSDTRLYLDIVCVYYAIVC